MVDCDTGGAKVVWGEPVDHWKWHRVESFVRSWVRDEAVVFLCVGGCPLLVLCVEAQLVQERTQCFDSGSPEDRLKSLSFG